MTAAADILAGVVADPDDDTARLVYADALEEAGRPAAAAFVRASVALGNGITVADADRCTAAERARPNHARRCRWCAYVARTDAAHGPAVREVATLFEAALPDLLPEADWGPPTRITGGGLRLCVAEYRANPEGPFTVLWRRGLPEEVTGTMAAFMGEGRRGFSELCRVFPVGTVRLTDRGPGRMAGDVTEACRFFWYRRGGPYRDGDHALLPPALFDALTGGEPACFDSPAPEFRDYPTEEGALAALSKACLAYARAPMAGYCPDT